MAISTINVGTSPNDGTGDTLRGAMQKINANFTEVFIGSGTLNYVPVFTGANSLGNSIIHINGSNVGIGTTGSSFKVDILSAATTDNRIRFAQPGDLLAGSFIGRAADSKILRIQNTEASDITFQTTNIVRATLDASGNLGIGGTPGAKLDVFGNIRSLATYSLTTAVAANLVINAAGDILRSTSSEREKDILEAISKDFSKNIYEIAKKCTLFYKSKSPNDNPDWTFYGLSAEKLAEIEPRLVHWGYFPEDYEIIEKTVLVDVEEIDKKGNKKVVQKEQIEKENVLKKDAKLSPTGVQYDRFVPFMLVEMEKQEEKIKELESRLTKLEKLLAK